MYNRSTALTRKADPLEMGNTHTAMIETLRGIDGYHPCFVEAFGSEAITPERVARALADYERTRMSGNSPYDRWRLLRDEDAVSERVTQGHALFFGKAACNQCHLGNNFTDSRFHNLGVGWSEKVSAFTDEGRYLTTGQEGRVPR